MFTWCWSWEYWRLPDKELKAYAIKKHGVFETEEAAINDAASQPYEESSCSFQVWEIK